MPPQLLHYRAWRGDFHGPAWSPWPIARVCLGMMFRRKLFWVMYGLALLTFLLFFFGQYLFAWTEAQAGEARIPIFAGASATPAQLMGMLRDQMHLNGSAITYRNFFWYQGYMVMIVLALAGTVLIGNDFAFGSLPFYLSKPLRPWHYLLGKCIAVGIFINLMTTLPAVILFIQYRTLYTTSFEADLPLLLGILGYGLVLTVFFSLMLVAVASWLRRAVPLIMMWTTLFLFFRLLANSLADILDEPRWRLIDLWNDTYLVGNHFLGLSPPRQPAWYEAALILGGMCLLCLTYLSLRIRAVEVVR